MHAMEKLFNPRGIAIIGATADLNRIGGQPIRALMAAGYTGAIYPVNPKYREVGGLSCYASAADIPGECDLAVIAVPAMAAIQAVADCGRKEIGYAIVLSGGFKEAGADGGDLQEALLHTAREAKVRLIGPNCQGMLNIPDRIYTVFGAIANEIELKSGNVSMAFQSGGFGFSLVLFCEGMGIGFRYCVSTGNEADMTTPELLDAFLDDPQTDIACAYIEGVPDGRQLMAVGEKSLRLNKTLIMWKGGKTQAGAKAAASHTASMTGSYDIYHAALAQSGIIEAYDIEEMADLIKVLELKRFPEGERVGVLGISGGSGIVFADTAVSSGLTMTEFAPETLATLRRVVPSFGSIQNPADITASIFNDIRLFTEAVNVVLSDPNVDQLCLLLASMPGKLALAAAQAIVAAARHSNKPITVGWSARRHRAPEAYEVLEAASIPIIPTPVRLARAAAALAHYAEVRRQYQRRTHISVTDPGWPAIPAESGTLSEVESKRLLASFGIPVTRDILVPAGEDALAAAADLRFPLAVKIVSPDIAHKTEVGGVQLSIPDTTSLNAAINAIQHSVQQKAPQARIDGFMLSEMVTDGVEALIGVLNDPTFGPTVAFGLGGIFTEVMHDLSYRVAPFDEATAMQMIHALRASALFAGVRGKPPLDTAALAHAIAAVSKMAWQLRDRLQELDINPIFIKPSGQGVVAADGLVVLR